MQTLTLIVTFVFLVQLAAMFGIFFAYSNSVVPGVSGVSDENAVAAMRSINVKIQNPLFLLTFTTPPLFGVLAGILLLNLDGDEGSAALLTFIAAAIYLILCIGVTGGINVPMNNQLENSTSTDYAKRWADFAPRWVRFNTVRTLACLISLVLMGVALYQWGQP